MLYIMYTVQDMYTLLPYVGNDGIVISYGYILSACNRCHYDMSLDPIAHREP